MRFLLFIKPHLLMLKTSKTSKGNIKAKYYESGKCEEEGCDIDVQTGRLITSTR